jgi:hypothetical protein
MISQRRKDAVPFSFPRSLYIYVSTIFIIYLYLISNFPLDPLFEAPPMTDKYVESRYRRFLSTMYQSYGCMYLPSASLACLFVGLT